MSAKECNIARLYWDLARNIHTKPNLRPYFEQVKKLVEEYKVSVDVLEKVGRQSR